jgi:hypothetical protein
MESRTLSRAAVANLLGVSEATVRSWLARAGTKHYRALPPPMLRLLELEIRLLPTTLDDAIAVEALSLNDFFTDCIKKA